MSHMPPNTQIDIPPENPRAPMPFPFAWKATLAASGTATAALWPAIGSYAPTTLVAIRDGQLVGLRAICETLAAGTATVAVTVNGVATSLTAVITASTPNGVTAVGAVSYVAGDTIGVSITASSDLSPASGWDVMVTLDAIVPVTAPAGVTDHGIPVINTTQWTTALSPDAAGTGWNYIECHWYGAVGETVHWVVLKDFTTTPVETLTETTTHQYPNSNYKIVNQLRAPNGRIFFPAFGPSTLYYDPTTETIHELGVTVESPPVDVNASTAFFVGYFDSAGKLYMTTQESHFRQSMIVVIDPTLTPPTPAVIGYFGTGALSYTTYGFRGVADTGTAFKSLYNAYGENPWQLWHTNITPGPNYGVSTKLYEVTSTGNIQFVEIVVTGTSKGWTAIIDTDLNQPDNVRTQWWCLDGALYAYTAGVDPPGGLARVVTPASAPLTTPPDVDTTGGAGIVLWRPNGSTGLYTIVDYAVENALPVAIETLFATADGIGGNGQQYNGVFQYHEPVDNRSWWGPWLSGLSEPCFVNVAGIIYGCGYPNGALYKWDPSQPWALRTSPNNPLNLGAIGLNGNQYAGIKYARRIAWSTAGVSGRVYVAGDRERNGVGCGLGYWDKQTATLAGVYSSADGSTGPTAMSAALTSGLVVDDTHGLVVLATRNVSGVGTATLFVFSQSLASSSLYTPLPGVANLGQIFPTSTAGIVCGVIQEAGGSLALYKVNVQTGALVGYVTTSIVGTLGAITRHPSGSIWAMVSRQLVRIDPDALTATVNAGLNSIMPIGVMSFAADGTTLFFSGGSPSGVNSAQIYSIAVTP